MAQLLVSGFGVGTGNQVLNVFPVLGVLLLEVETENVGKLEQS